MALRNATLFAESERRRCTAEALAEVGRVVSQALQMREVAARIVESVRRLLGGHAATLFRSDPATGDLTLLATTGLTAPFQPGVVFPEGTGVVGLATRERTVIMTPDLLADPRVQLPAEFRAYFEHGRHRAVLAVPLIVQDRAVGALSVADRFGRAFTDEEIHLAQRFADQATIALENARLYSAQERRAARLRALAHLNQMVSSSLDVDAVLGGIARAAATLMDAPLVEFWLANETMRTLELRVFSDPGLGADKQLKTLAFGEGGVGWVAVHRRLLNIPNVFADGRIRRLDWWRTHDLRSGLWVPIIFGDTLLGVLSVCSHTPFQVGSDDHDLLDSFVAQAAVAIRHAKLFADSEARRRAAETLASVGHALAQAIEPGEVAQQIADSVCGLLDVQCSALFWLEPGSGDLVRLAVSGDATPLGERVVFPQGTGVIALAVRDREAVVTPDLLSDPRVALTPAMRTRIEQAGYRAALAIPLLAPDRVIGALAVGDRAGRYFDPQQIQLAQTFADQAALALQNARVLHELKTRQERLEALLDVTRQLAAIQPVESLLGTIAEACGDLLDSESVGFRLLEGDELVVTGKWGDAAQIMNVPRLKIGESLSGIVAATGEPLVVNDVANDPRVILAHREALRRAGYTRWLGVPVKKGDRLVGVLSIRTRRDRDFSEADLAIATAFASQAAVALDNARLFAEVQRRVQSLETLARITQVLSGATDRTEVFDFITRSALELLGAKLVRLWVQRPGTSQFAIAASCGLDPGLERQLTSHSTIPLGMGLVGRIAESKMPEFIADVRTDERWLNRDLADHLGSAGFAGLPLVVGDTVVGVLAVLTGPGRTLDQAEQDVLAIFADQAAIAIDKAQLYERLAGKTRRLEGLNRLALRVTATLDQQEAFSSVTEAAREFFGDVACSLWVLGPESAELTLASDVGLRFPELGLRGSLKVGHGLVGRVAAQRRAIVLDDVQHNPVYQNRAQSAAEGFHTAIAVPLLCSSRCYGVLSVRGRSTAPFLAEDVNLLNALAGHAAITIEHARLYEAITRTNRHLKEQASTLEAKNAELDSFAYSVSHDLKAPLVTIQGMAGLLLEDYSATLDARGARYLQRIQANIGQMERLISDLLALSRVGREARPPEAITLADVVDAVLIELDDPIRRRGVRVCHHTPHTVWAVRTQIEQVLTNLVSNAVKYLGDTAEPALEIGSVDRGALVECYVCDNGIGIDPAYHEKVFELFQRLKEVEAEGTGVGLPIVKKIVEVAGGRVWVESARGQGATFRFTWPTGPEQRAKP